MRQVFSNVAGSYDIMNDLMSGGLHRLWKDRCVVARLAARCSRLRLINLHQPATKRQTTVNVLISLWFLAVACKMGRPRAVHVHTEIHQAPFHDSPADALQPLQLALVQAVRL